MDLFWEKLGRLVKPEMGEVPLAEGPHPFRETPLTVSALAGLIEGSAHYVITPRSSTSFDVTESFYKTVALGIRGGTDHVDTPVERLCAAMAQAWENAMSAANVKAFAAMEWRQPPRVYEHKDVSSGDVTHMVMMRLSVFEHWPKMKGKVSV